MDPSTEKNILIGFVVLVIAIGLVAVLFLFKPPAPTCPPAFHLENGNCVPDSTTPPVQPPVNPPAITVSGNFDEAYEQMAGLWQDAGVKTPILHRDFEELAQLPESELQVLKSQFQSIRDSAENDEVKTLSRTYFYLTDVALAQQKVNKVMSAVEEIPSEDDSCTHTDAFANLNAQMRTLVENTKLYLASVEAFVGAYPASSKKIALFSPASQAYELDGVMASQDSVLTSLIDACATEEAS